MVSTTKRYGIIVGIDGSPESDAAVNWAAHDAAIRGLPLTVVHVESPAAATWSQAPVLEESPEEQQAEGRSLLAHASTIARDAIADTAQVHITGELLSSSTPVPTLVEQSKDAELIVVGSRGRGALSRSILGSAPAATPRSVTALGKRPHEERQVGRSLGQSPHEVPVPLSAERHVDPNPVACRRQPLSARRRGCRTASGIRNLLDVQPVSRAIAGTASMITGSWEATIGYPGPAISTRRQRRYEAVTAAASR